MTRLGEHGPDVSRVGSGCMGMSGMYGPAERKESIATVHAALDAGINLLDTGDFYGMGHNETLVGEALSTRSRDEAVISVKFGAQRGPDGGWLGYDARPAAVKTALAYSSSAYGSTTSTSTAGPPGPQGPELSRGLISGQWSPIVPLIGARTRERLTEARGALDLNLSDEDIDKIEQAMPAEAALGDRYPAAQMGQFDSER